MSLIRLQIENFAIIEHLAIDFRSGLTILTGETGAGKSIIIDALNLTLGEKANPNLVRAGAESAVVECDFLLSENSTLRTELLAKGINLAENKLTIRREVHTNGRSRAWINGTSCPLTLLKEVGKLLVDLHGQHDHQSLLDETTHIQFLDAFGNYEALLQKVAQLYEQVQTLRDKQILLCQKLEILREKRELWAFQLQEITKIAPRPGEYESLLEEKTLLENAEKLHLLIRDLNEEISESPDSLYQKVLRVIRNMGQLGRLTERFNGEINQLTEHQYFYQELARTLVSFAETVQFNPLRLENVNQRLYSLQQLMKKYGPDLATVIAKQNQLQADLNQEDDLQMQIEATEKQLQLKIDEYLQCAKELTQQRQNRARLFEQELQQVLHRLGIRGATFRVAIDRVPEAGSWAVIDGIGWQADRSGLDKVTFEISTNVGEPLRPLSVIVSGGEVSRIMLGIKSVLTGRDQIPVLIFDEIDSGISGQIARIVGEELRNLARVHQVICITHLPQIASLADDHLYVSKTNLDGRSRTTVKRLNNEERVVAIAELLGGENITETAKQQARELML